MLLGKLLRKLTVYRSRRQQQAGRSGAEETKLLYTDLNKNIDWICAQLGNSQDVKAHRFILGGRRETPGALIYVAGLTDTAMITEGILTPLTRWDLVIKTEGVNYVGKPGLMRQVQQAILCTGDVKEANRLNQLVQGCLGGNTVLLLEGQKEGLLIGTQGWEKRNVSEPQTESVVRGPREGFTEDFRTNTALLRKRIKSPDLRMDQLVIGEKTLTAVCVAYLEQVAKPEVVATVKARLQEIQVDSILDSGYIEAYIEENPFSVFPTVGYTEKPDVVAGKILEGRVAILVDGSPFALTVPLLFIESFQTAEDYYTRPLYASGARLMRVVSYFVAIFTIPIFIALTTFHQELIPTTLLFTIVNAREGTPFPAFVEGLIMVYSMEILREAGVRLPRPVGQAISIVGALIMGDAAVAAGLVGAPTVIAVALTAVAGFVIPSQIDSASILRLIIMVLSALLGGFGIAMGFLCILVHLATLKSFGADYFGSVIPSYEQQDSFVRLPLWSMDKRPETLAEGNIHRRGKVMEEGEVDRE